jgi:hypothetical protein
MALSGRLTPPGNGEDGRQAGSGDPFHAVCRILAPVDQQAVALTLPGADRCRVDLAQRRPARAVRSSAAAMATLHCLLRSVIGKRAAALMQVKAFAAQSPAQSH